MQEHSLTDDEVAYPLDKYNSHNKLITNLLEPKREGQKK